MVSLIKVFSEVMTEEQLTQAKVWQLDRQLTQVEQALARQEEKSKLLLSYKGELRAEIVRRYPNTRW